MTERMPPGSAGASGFWIEDDVHRAYLARDARRQFDFFEASLSSSPGFQTLDIIGNPLPDPLQELHTTTRLVHSYALGQIWGVPGAERIVDHGMLYLSSHHRDRKHGGYLWGISNGDVADGRKLAYGHVFVLLAGASAKMAGHADADALIVDASEVLEAHFWDEDAGLFRDEFNRDWSPFSSYRGMNANMHGVEALLGAFEATGDDLYLERAGRIVDFFVGRMAPEHGWRLPEHYDDEWNVDRAYIGDPMFRPEGTTPGHSFELGRLALQYWDLAGRPDDSTPGRARKLIETALDRGWREDRGGIAYTLDFDGNILNGTRYWWPVTEAIGALASLIKLERRDEDEGWYRRLWSFADRYLVDHEHGGWFPELGEDDKPASGQFKGKPDIYHSLQACLFPLTSGLTGQVKALRDLEI